MLLLTRGRRASSEPARNSTLGAAKAFAALWAVFAALGRSLCQAPAPVVLSHTGQPWGHGHTRAALAAPKPCPAPAARPAAPLCLTGAGRADASFH